MDIEEFLMNVTDPLYPVVVAIRNEIDVARERMTDASEIERVKIREYIRGCLMCQALISKEQYKKLAEMAY